LNSSAAHKERDDAKKIRPRNPNRMEYDPRAFHS
jgi:hypothetical protein